MEYLMLLSAALLLAVDFALNKVYQKIFGVTPSAVLLFNCILSAFTALIFFALNGCKLNYTNFSLIMSGAMNLLIMAYNAIGFRLLKNGTMAVYTLFLMAGGMVLPFLWGAFFLHESFSWLRLFGLLIILCGVIFANMGGNKMETKHLFLCFAVFILNGIVSIVSKMHQIEAVLARVNPKEFIVLGNMVKCFVSSVLYFLMKKANKKEEEKTPTKQEKITEKKIIVRLVLIALSATVGGISYMLQLFGAEKLPAGVLYPFITGGSIAFSSVLGMIIFKEKLSPKQWMSVVCCLAGTVMFI